jgi:hypothetical protein
MLSPCTAISPVREAGVVHTKPWLVELVLDLAGYLPEKRLAELVVLEPSAGDGAFLSALVRRLVESCARAGTDLRAVRENEQRMSAHGWMFHRLMINFIRKPFAGPPGGGSLPTSPLNSPLTTHPEAVQMTA